MELQHEDKQKVETTLGGLKAAFATWERDIRADREAFVPDDEFAALTPEECGELSGRYFLGLLTKKPGNKAAQN